MASWLPGTEGAGVADVLFGARPFTGRLPVSWPASADQVPVNVGDATYAPLYPYGWGLRTDAQRDRLTALVATLPAGAAQDAVQAVLDAPVWDGTALDPARTGRRSACCSPRPRSSTAPTATPRPLRGSSSRSSRDLAQDASGAPTDAAALTADAEHALMSGDASGAVDLLADVLGVSTAPPVASTTSLSLSSSVKVFGNAGDRTRDGARSRAARRPGPCRCSSTVRRWPPCRSPRTAPRRSGSPRTSAPAATRSRPSTGAPRRPTRRSGSTSAAATLRVTRTLPTVRTDGTDWTVRRSDPKQVHVQVAGVAGVTPTGTVDVWVNGSRKGSATLDARGTAVVTLPVGHPDLARPRHLRRRPHLPAVDRLSPPAGGEVTPNG